MEFKHLNSLLSGSSICIRFGILNLVCMLPCVWLELSKSEATGESGIFSFGGGGVEEIMLKAIWNIFI